MEHGLAEIPAGSSAAAKVASDRASIWANAAAVDCIRRRLSHLRIQKQRIQLPFRRPENFFFVLLQFRVM
jgi:hypothetical protein